MTGVHKGKEEGRKGVSRLVDVDRLQGNKRTNQGRLASQISHFSVADSGFCNMQVSHVQGPDFRSAALALGCPNMKLDVGGLGGPPAGRGASHMVHFSLADSGFCSMQVSHVQFAPVVAVDVIVGVAALAAGVIGRGASQMVHFSLAEAGLWSMQVSHVHCAAETGAVVFVDGLDELAAVRSKTKSFVDLAMATDCAALSFSVAGIVTLKTKEGSEPEAWLRALIWADEKARVFFAALADCVIEARVEFSISASDSAGLDGVSVRTGFSIALVCCTGAVDCGFDGLGAGAKDGIGRAGEEISGASKAGTWKGSGILGIGLDGRIEELNGPGGGDGDRAGVSSDDSSMSSSTSIASRDGEGV